MLFFSLERWLDRGVQWSGVQNNSEWTYEICGCTICFLHFLLIRMMQLVCMQSDAEDTTEMLNQATRLFAVVTGSRNHKDCNRRMRMNCLLKSGEQVVTVQTHVEDKVKKLIRAIRLSAEGKGSGNLKDSKKNVGNEGAEELREGLAAVTLREKERVEGLQAQLEMKRQELSESSLVSGVRWMFIP